MDEEYVNKLFSEGFDCSQIVLAEVSEQLGMDREQAYAVASCYGLGIFEGNICGAAMGAMMALGLKYGNTVPNDAPTKMMLFEKRKQFLDRFRELNGAISCPDLLGKLVTDIPQMMTESKNGLFLECPRYCVNAVNILNEML